MIRIFCVLLQICFFCNVVYAAQGSFSWEPNTESDLAGYKIYFSDTSEHYTDGIDVKIPPTKEDGRVHVTIDIPDGMTYAVATAYDSEGNESDYSNEISFNVAPSPPKNFQSVTVTVKVEVN